MEGVKECGTGKQEKERKMLTMKQKEGKGLRKERGWKMEYEKEKGM